MEDAIQHGCKKIIMGLGGSCTNDAVTGAAAALGVAFTDKDGNSFVPVGDIGDGIEEAYEKDLKRPLHNLGCVATFLI